MLKPATPNEIPNHTQSPPPPLEVQAELEYKIPEILDSKIDRCRACKLLYLVRWLCRSFKFPIITDLGS
jgi:hypothetical protein